MKLAYPAFAVAKASAKGKCCERRRRSRAQCLSACTGVVDFIDHDLEIDYEKEMTRIQAEMKELMKEERQSRQMLEDAFRGIGYGID